MIAVRIAPKRLAEMLNRAGGVEREKRSTVSARRLHTESRKAKWKDIHGTKKNILGGLA